ncbi:MULTISPECIES: TRADD-N-associated membrane domain-containing protein [unclassified Streptomyces]|uniref:TRADD-N-associated membrane domain-containing protein n=1 Tax=unclassified Streptomyces TaxID=2593676 RepID=UPI000A6B54CA|nr:MULTISPECIES: hypothetical protein [unclassified Streptomyces]
MGDWLAWGAVGAAVVGAVVLLAMTERFLGAGFERRRDAERARLLDRLADTAEGDPQPTAVPGQRKFEDVGGGRSAHTQLGGSRDDFTPILVEYYAYGLAQARSSFGTSQRFAGAGAAILLVGLGLAVRKAETGGELYLGVVMAATGLVTTLIGQLFHRRADIALRHMADQSAALRDDRRAAETTRQAIGLLETVDDPELRARLQAGLIMKLSGAELPR